MIKSIQLAKLESAIEKLREADALVQEALEACDTCFDVHMDIEDCITDIHEAMEEL